MAGNNGNKSKVGAALIVGGGISGMQAALDLAEAGIKVYLLEKETSIGGGMVKLDKIFPTTDCAMCTIGPRLVTVGRHLNIQMITNAEVQKVSGSDGNFTVTIKKKARYVDLDKCKGCGDCTQACPVDVRNAFEEGLVNSKAIYRLFPQAVPGAFAVHKDGTSPCRPASSSATTAVCWGAVRPTTQYPQSKGYPGGATSIVSTLGGTATLVGSAKSST